MELKFIFTALTTFTILFVILTSKYIEDQNFSNQDKKLNHTQEINSFNGFLIESENCKILNLSPFSSNITNSYEKLKFKKCHPHGALTFVMQDKNFLNFLMINKKETKNFLQRNQNDIECCYHRVTRSGVEENADNEYKMSKCIKFKSGHKLNKQEDAFIVVKCDALLNVFGMRFKKFQVYSNAHAVVIRKEKSLSKLKTEVNPSVLLIGIDSVSRLNFIRFMPETFQFLTKNRWHDMKIYNKIGENTFPNLNAILVGKNLSTMSNDCNWSDLGGIEKCRFMWNEFSDANYVTAYAEDVQFIHTFNYLKHGFINQPTDHYLRPFTLAAETHVSPGFSKPWIVNCLGYIHYADYILQYALDFARAYKNKLFFGLFWMNSFSHEELNHSSEYDSRMRFYLEKLQDQETLNNTIVIFLSDHGMRFGKIRQLFTGWLEDKLPLLFIWLPESFKQKYPEFAENLRINQNRLVSPFDLHITLKHILKLSGDSHQKLKAFSCKSCQSLFQEIPQNRSCADAGIRDQWCACNSFRKIQISQPNVENAVNFAINELNLKMAPYRICAKIKLRKILKAYENSHLNILLLVFEVLPSFGVMEATIQCKNEECNEFEIIGEILRISRYGTEGSCMNDAILEKYCYCIN